MSADPGGDVRAAIEAAGIGFTAGTNLFDGPEQSQGTGVPNEAAFVLPYGGPPPSAFCGNRTAEERYPAVQVLYRSDVDDFDGGESTARAILGALHHQTIFRGVGGSYTDCTGLQSLPLYIGVDESRRHRWTINLELWHRE
jgi:hypothetical protein